MKAARVMGVGLAVAVMAVALLGSASALSPRADGRIYANGELYATFGATTFDGGSPQSLDVLFQFPGTGLVPVGEAAPGEPGYNAGRWDIRHVSFTGMAPTQFTSDDEVWYHYGLGHLEISGNMGYLVCPLFKL